MPDALVLAGGRPDPTLAPGVPNKAFLPVCGRPMVEFVLRALRAGSTIGRVALVGPEALPSRVGSLADVVLAERSGLLENVSAGLAALGADRVVAVAADLPLLTSEGVDAFVRGAETLDAEIVYGIVPREDVLREMPAASKTFVRMREGTFTGASLVVLDAAAFGRARPVIERAVAARKHPWELARLFGVSTVLGFVTGRLRIAQVEARAHRVMGVRIRALVSRMPEIAIDIDAPSMLPPVEARLRGRLVAPPAPGHGLACR